MGERQRPVGHQHDDEQENRARRHQPGCEREGIDTLRHQPAGKHVVGRGAGRQQQSKQHPSHRGSARQALLRQHDEEHASEAERDAEQAQPAEGFALHGERQQIGHAGNKRHQERNDRRQQLVGEHHQDQRRARQANRGDEGVDP